MTELRFSVGDLVTLTNTFTVAGVATDPTTVSLAVTDPSGTTTTYTYAGVTITKSGTGVYTKDVTASSAGTWRYVWTGTTAAADVQDGSFEVFAAANLTTYATLEQFRSELGNYQTTDTSDDAKLQRALDAASRQIDGHCGQRFWQDAAVTARTFAPDNVSCLDFSDGDGISTSTGLLVKLDLTDTGTYGTTLTINTDFLLRPSNAAVMIPARPFTEIWLTGSTYLFSSSSYGRQLVQVTAKWGWPVVPDEVEKACLILANDLFKSKDVAFGVAGTTEFGTLRVTSGISRTAKALLEPYRKPTVA